MGIILSIINTITSLLVFLIFIYSLLGYFLSPYHPIRRILGQVIEPLLNPIRRRIPPINGLDLSPLILIIILYVFRALITAIFRSLG